jgi:hypothetical protein
MTCWQAMNRLEALGYSFHLDVSGRAVGVLAGETPPEASALLEIARADRAAAADYIRQREAGAVVVDDGCTYSVLDALAIGQAVKHGDAVLLGPVIFHREPVNVSVYWRPVRGVAEAVLEWHRERLEKALRRRLQKMEQTDLDGMTEAEIDRFCEKYSRYKLLWGGCCEQGRCFTD